MTCDDASELRGCRRHGRVGTSRRERARSRPGGRAWGLRSSSDARPRSPIPSPRSSSGGWGCPRAPRRTTRPWRGTWSARWSNAAGSTRTTCWRVISRGSARVRPTSGTSRGSCSLGRPRARPDAAREYVEQRGPEVSAGNGSVMYCAPLGVAYAFRPDDLFELAPALSAVTHWDERCRTACLAVTLAVAALVRGEPGDRAVIAAVTAVAEREGGEELEYLVEAAGRARPVDGPDMGFTLFTAGSGAAGRGRAAGVRTGAAVRGRSRRRHRHERRGGGSAPRSDPRSVRTPGDVAGPPAGSRSDRGRGDRARGARRASEADGSGRIGGWRRRTTPARSAKSDA